VCHLFKAGSSLKVNTCVTCSKPGSSLEVNTCVTCSKSRSSLEVNTCVTCSKPGCCVREVSLWGLSGGGHSRRGLRFDAHGLRRGRNNLAPQPRLPFPVLPPSGGIAPKQAHALECPPPDNPQRETSRTQRPGLARIGQRARAPRANRRQGSGRASRAPCESAKRSKSASRESAYSRERIPRIGPK
jgi:hypothetical protein